MCAHASQVVPSSSRLFGREHSIDQYTAVSPHLDVLPEADAASGRGLRGARRLVDPGVARMTHAVDHHVIELDAMRTGAVLVGHRRLLEPVRAHVLRREIEIAVVLHDVVALGDDLTLESGLHCSLTNDMIRIERKRTRIPPMLHPRYALPEPRISHVRYATRPPLQ